MKKIIITQRHIIDKHKQWTDVLENEYIIYLESFGVQCISISNASRFIDKLIDDIKPDGIILSGGEDINPKLYGGREEGVSQEFFGRDELEMQLISIAKERLIPVLGICRGMQLINVFFDGTLTQDIQSIDKKNIHLSPGTHEIKIINKKLIEQYGRNRVLINSYHNQGVIKKNLGNVEIFAIFEGLQLVEGLYHKRYPIAGIQWHPERKLSAKALDKFLIKSFVNKKLFWEVEN